MCNRTLGLLPILLLAVGMAPAAASATSGKTRDNCSKIAPAKDLVFVVDGLSGTVIKRPQRFARPCEEVTVKVVCADLIDYEYTIAQTDKIALVETIPIVGGPPPASKAQAAGPGAGPRSEEILDLAAPPPTNESLLKEFQILQKNHATAAKKILGGIKTVQELATTLPTRWFDKDKKNKKCGSCDEWPPLLREALSDYDENSGVLGSALHDDAQAISDFSSKLQQIKLWLAVKATQTTGTTPAKDAKPSPKALTAEFVQTLMLEANKLENGVTDIRKKLEETAGLVEYWEHVIALHKSPVLQQTFPVDHVSSRYIVQVQRRPVSAGAKDLEKPDQEGKYPFATIASLAFEGHALARFNLTMGLVGIRRPDDRAFSIAPRVEADDTVSYHVIESESTDLKLDAGLFLGIYLGKPVDPFDREKGAWMLMLGTEFATSPSTFYLGLGYDTPTGIVFGAGVTQYRRTSLADGWKVGQLVPLKDDGSSKVSMPPTVKDDAIGAYVLVGFRPALFKAWWAARKN